MKLILPRTPVISVSFLVNVLVISLILASANLMTGCSKSEEESSKQSTTTVKSTALNLAQVTAQSKRRWVGRATTADGTVVLKNITGLADAIVFNVPNACGYVVWSSAQGSVATAGRTQTDFDLGNSSSWTTEQTGMREACAGGKAHNINTYFAYMDLHLLVESTEKVLRVSMGNYEAMKKGDLLIQQGTEYHWVDSNTQTLSATRPDSPVQITSVANATLGTDADGVAQILASMDVNIVNSAGEIVELTFSHGVESTVIDFNFDNAIINIEDTSSDAAIVTTFDGSFLSDITSSLSAKVQVTAEGTTIDSATLPSAGISSTPTVSYVGYCKLDEPLHCIGFKPAQGWIESLATTECATLSGTFSTTQNCMFSSPDSVRVGACEGATKNPAGDTTLTYAVDWIYFEGNTQSPNEETTCTGTMLGTWTAGAGT